MVMERVGREYNRLQYNVSLADDHPLIEEMTPRIARITATLQDHLQDKFRASIEHKDREGLLQSLQAYAAINRQSAAEEMFQNVVVCPYMEEVSLASGSEIFGFPLKYSPLVSNRMYFKGHSCCCIEEVAQF